VKRFKVYLKSAGTFSPMTIDKHFKVLLKLFLIIHHLNLITHHSLFCPLTGLGLYRWQVQVPGAGKKREVRKMGR
jgi:hypothetical protein